MTNVEFYINVGDADIAYGESGADYLLVDLVNDYLIWTAGDDTVKDGMTSEPTETQLTNASPIISETVPVQVAKCLLMDYSAESGEPVLREVVGMGEDLKPYSFLFKFDGATATEPQLEAWDDDTMLTIENKVLGGADESPVENPEDSMLLGVCSTTDPVGEDWGAPLAGDGETYVLPLNQGDGALTVAKDLYANLKIIIPTNFAYPAIETFSLVIRYNFVS